MEHYKKAIKTRILLLIILVVSAVALGVYDVFLATPETKESFIFGFQCGAAISMGTLAIVLICRYRAVLGDEKKLKLQFNKENDERRKAIRAKAGMPMLLITSILMIITGIIAGYFNPIIFVTLTAAALCQMLIGGIVKILYTKEI